MKKAYESPRFYMEEFVPNEYAVLCAPGIDESKAEPYVQTCYYYDHGGYYDGYAYVYCSNEGENLAFLTTETTGCRMKLDSKGNVSGTGVSKVEWDFEHPYTESGTKQDAYRWSNQAGGYHYIPVTQFGGTTNGKPTYFNS